jgi:ribonuclease HI
MIDEEGEETEWRAARAAIRHCGQVRGGRLYDANDSYTTELVALLDAVAHETEETVMVLFDASSPPEALRSWRSNHERRKRDYYNDEELGAVNVHARKLKTLVFFWVKAHSGVTINEWVDMEAAEGLRDGKPVLREMGGNCEHRSVAVRGVEKAAGAKVTEMLQARVCEKLASCSRDTIWRSEGDWEYPAGSRRDEDLLARFRQLRVFPGDKAGLMLSRLEKGARSMACPGCGALGGCTWVHACLECVAYREERKALRAATIAYRDANGGKEQTSQEQAELVAKTLEAGVKGYCEAGWCGGKRVTAEEHLLQLMQPQEAAEQELRGFLGGCKRRETSRIDKNLARAVDVAMVALLRKSSEAVDKATAELANARKAELALSGAWETWRRRLREEGPARAAARRQLWKAMRIAVRNHRAAGGSTGKELGRRLVGVRRDMAKKCEGR